MSHGFDYVFGPLFGFLKDLADVLFDYGRSEELKSTEAKDKRYNRCDAVWDCWVIRPDEQ